MSSERVTLPIDLLPSNYHLDITPDFVNNTFNCKETIDVTVQNSCNQFSLNARDLSIKSVKIQNQSAIEINYNLKYHVVTFIFENPLTVGEAIVEIELVGILNNEMAGFYRSTYVDENGNKKIMGSTQFEALDARRAFACWDEPARKATYTVVFTIEKHLVVLSNMPEIEVIHFNTGKKKVTFAKTPIMSTYLLAWVIGEFDSVSAITKSGVSIRCFTPPGRASEAYFALDIGVKCLDFYDNFFQIRYPLPKLDMISIPEFAAGAMENWGLVTYRENAIMISPKAASITKQRVASVVAHELAHQWFGNLVTMAWWDGLWLNEGFASFMQELSIDTILPNYKMFEQYTVDTFGAAQRLDSLRSSHPIIVPIKHAQEVEQVFDAISYSKGSTVVNMIFNTLGFEKFQKGLQLYFERHAYKNTETKDLWDCWTEVSGINVNEMMNVWTTRLGYPYLSVVSETWSETFVEFTLRQTWFLADGSLTEEERNEASPPVWHIPLLFATSTSVSDKAVIMNKYEQTFTIPLSGATDYVKINANQKALVRVAHSAAQLQRLTKTLLDLSAIDVSSLLLDNYALAKAGYVSIDNVVTILKSIDGTASYGNESGMPSYNLWQAVSGILTALQIQLEEIGGETYDAFHSFAKALVVKAVEKVGWENRESDGHTDRLLRSTLINLLDVFAYNDPIIVAEAKSRFQRHFTDPNALPSEYKTTVYKIVLLNGGKAEYDQILQTFYATEDNQEKKYALLSLGATPDESLKIKTLDWATKSGDVKLQDFFYAYGVVANGKNSSSVAWDYYVQNFDYIIKKISNASPFISDAVIVQAASKFITAEKANEIEEFFKLHPVPSSQRRILQTLELIRSNAKLLDIIRSSSLVTDPNVWK